jgi:hypothetical protein
VGVAFCGESVEEIPAVPEVPQTEDPENETSQEERECKRRTNQAHSRGETERENAKPETLPLPAAELAQAGGGVVDSSCIHGA